MYEKVNIAHPDKVADRIAGAIVDLAYSKRKNPKCAVEVLIGHNKCHIINETDTHISKRAVNKIVARIAGNGIKVDYQEVKQDPILSKNQKECIRCGDNGIFKGVPVTLEQSKLIAIAKDIYAQYPYDGKYVIDGSDLIICQSHCNASPYSKATFNPLGYWEGGINTDSGATNRKLGSDMGDAVTGGGLHGKDLSKADVSVNIYAHLKAQQTGKVVHLKCAIGDTEIDGKPYSEIVEIARKYINDVGGFEALACWGLLR